MCEKNLKEFIFKNKYPELGLHRESKNARPKSWYSQEKWSVLRHVLFIVHFSVNL